MSIVFAISILFFGVVALKQCHLAAPHEWLIVTGARGTHAVRDGTYWTLPLLEETSRLDNRVTRLSGETEGLWTRDEEGVTCRWVFHVCGPTEVSRAEHAYEQLSWRSDSDLERVLENTFEESLQNTLTRYTWNDCWSDRASIRADLQDKLEDCDLLGLDVTFVTIRTFETSETT